VDSLAMLLLAKIKERRRWQSNFCAQRAVGDMLSQLMLDGCRVFHGFRLPGYGKIDHVVVAPTGVYAVETEPRAANVRSRNKQMVNYDGKSLNFADGSDTGKLGQIRREAGRFSRVLTNALKIPIQVKPVIALPGGCVRITGEQPYDVLVINPRFLRDAIVTHGPVALGRDQIEKIAAHLDAKCRDVLVG